MTDSEREENVQIIDDDKIRFIGEINRKTMAMLINELYTRVKELKSSHLNYSEGTDQQTKPTLYLFLSTDGGHLFPAFAAYDHLIKVRKHVHLVTIAEGFVASSGTILLLAGDQRLATKNTGLLFHQLSSGLCGKYNDLKDHMESCDWLMKKVVRLYGKKSKLPKTSIKKLLTQEKVLSPKKCIKMGFIDGLF